MSRHILQQKLKSVFNNPIFFVIIALATAKAQVRLRFSAVSYEPFLFAHTKYKIREQGRIQDFLKLEGVHMYKCMGGSLC